MILLQAATATEAVVTKSINLWTMAQYGGWIMIILGLLFLGAVYIFIERMVVIKAATKEDKTFMNRIRDYIHEGKIDSAIKLCQQTNTPSARMVEKGITRIGRPMQDVQVAIENVGNLEVSKLEKGLVLMATIAGGAPMLGFLGTVLGMVQTFFEMANKAGGAIDMSTLSTGMYQAMVTTIGGLIVGIIAMFAYNLLVSRIDHVVRRLESRTMEFMDVLNDPA
ncbi:MAG: MotA/TolQ/ExbB proton channel family protein [Paludibacteraceae bacterium]|jgi:biopolymer transport protein ExbB|nr:MotA/TolQ/ExbB proton channel family protein [Paludibacteraceae bacterium]MBR1716006.1 MotA/TolQ/ExbB proton channel family protein [Paludibacteraceae bacterium]